MAAEMSFAQALTEAKSIIVQQSQRIKADAEKIKAQAQLVVEQRLQIGEMEKRLAEMEALRVDLEEMKASRASLEAEFAGRGERIAAMETTVREHARTVTEQADWIERLTAERDGLRDQVPSQEDAEALAVMTALLGSKQSAQAARAEMRGERPENKGMKVAA
jgi:chromosome segregation ATPase